MIFSPQMWFCNACGKKMFSAPCNAMIGGFRLGYRVCSEECSKEMQWRHTLSVMGSPYRTREGVNKQGGTDEKEETEQEATDQGNEALPGKDAG